MRSNGAQEFFDLRTILVHEIGHALGSQHPDASWDNSPQSSFNRNFLPNGQGGWNPGPPPGGEVMNEGIAGGEYNRVVSKDELALLDHSYGGQIQFQQVFGNTPADITLSMHNIGGNPGPNLGSAGPELSELRVPGQPKQGRRLLESTVSLNAVPDKPIGFVARASSWEVTNPFAGDMSQLWIRTNGTDNPVPTSRSSFGPNRFTQYDNSTPFPFEFEDVLHKWTMPFGGGIAPGKKVGIGLRQDVWDWTAVNAIGFAEDPFDFGIVNLVTVFNWLNMGPPGMGNNLDNFDEVIFDDARDPGEVLAAGIAVLNGELAATITEVSFAPVGGLDLSLSDLNSDTLEQFRRDGRLETLRIPSIDLDTEELFVLVLDGTLDDLPPELIASGNFLLLDRPDLLDEELFVFVGSQSNQVPLGSFSLLNSGVFVQSTPEPSTFTLSALGLLSLSFVGWRRRRR